MSQQERELVVRQQGLIRGERSLAIPLPQEVDLPTALTASSRAEQSFAEASQLVEKLTSPLDKVKAYISLAENQILAGRNPANILRLAESEARKYKKEESRGSSSRIFTHLLINIGKVYLEVGNPAGERLFAETYTTIESSILKLTPSFEGELNNTQRPLKELLTGVEDLEELTDAMLVDKDSVGESEPRAFSLLRETIYNENITRFIKSSDDQVQFIRILNRFIKLQVYSGDIAGAQTSSDILKNIHYSGFGKGAEEIHIQKIGSLSLTAAAQSLLAGQAENKEIEPEDMQLLLESGNLEAVEALGYSAKIVYQEFLESEPSDEMKKAFLKGFKKKLADQEQTLKNQQKLVEAEMQDLDEN